MSDELEVDGGSHAPIWAAFGDLMSVLLGAFVLILVGVVAVQLELSQRLDQEVKQRQAEAKRLQTLEQALAGPLAAGRVTLVDGRIGISGSVLFALNSDQLQPEGQELLRSLTSGLGVALLTTMVGLVGNILLGLQLTRLDRYADALVADIQRAGLARAA